MHVDAILNASFPHGLIWIFDICVFAVFAQDSQGECALCLDEYSAGDCVTRLTCFHATGLQWAPVGSRKMPLISSAERCGTRMRTS